MIDEMHPITSEFFNDMRQAIDAALLSEQTARDVEAMFDASASATRVDIGTGLRLLSLAHAAHSIAAVKRDCSDMPGLDAAWYADVGQRLLRRGAEIIEVATAASEARGAGLLN